MERFGTGLAAGCMGPGALVQKRMREQMRCMQADSARAGRTTHFGPRLARLREQQSLTIRRIPIKQLLMHKRFGQSYNFNRILRRGHSRRRRTGFCRLARLRHARWLRRAPINKTPINKLFRMSYLSKQERPGWPQEPRDAPEDRLTAWKGGRLARRRPSRPRRGAAAPEPPERFF